MPRIDVSSVESVRAEVGKLQELDDERAHINEDQLHRQVLERVAAEAPEPWRSLATEALKSLELEFDRWYA